MIPASPHTERRHFPAFSLLLAVYCLTPLQADPQRDIREFQNHFVQRFPHIPLQGYARGFGSQSESDDGNVQLRTKRFKAALEAARGLWVKPLANGESLHACFQNNPSATKYPYYDNNLGEIRTIELDMNQCLIRSGERPLSDLMQGKMALLTAAFREQFNGQSMAVDLATPEAVAAYERGKKLYWTKRGQLNFSCADCHVHHAGGLLRGDLLSTGLGHGSGFPAYRTQWAQQGDPWGTLHRRYAECNRLARAKPYAAQSEEYRSLELYEAVMNTGIPIHAPSLRP